MYTNWIIVVNNKELQSGYFEETAQDFYDALPEIVHKNKPILKYICGQMEYGENVHFQGYIQLQRTERLSWLKKNIHKTAHFEPQKAKTNDKARHYTMKPVEDCTCKHCLHEVEHPTKMEEYEWVEYGPYTKGCTPGKNGKQGQRTDIEDWTKLIIEGLSDEELLIQKPDMYVKYYKVIDRIRMVTTRHSIIKDKKVILHYGYPGKRKTERLVEQYPDAWMETFDEDVWFDGYYNQQNAIFDEFNGKMSKMSLSRFLTLTDRVVRRVRIKGSFVFFKPQQIDITTNTHPVFWYDYTSRQGEYQCLKRRLFKVYWYPKDMDPTDEPQDVTEDADFWTNPDAYY